MRRCDAVLLRRPHLEDGVVVGELVQVEPLHGHAKVELEDARAQLAWPRHTFAHTFISVVYNAERTHAHTARNSYGTDHKQTHDASVAWWPGV